MLLSRSRRPEAWRVLMRFLWMTVLAFLPVAAGCGVQPEAEPVSIQSAVQTSTSTLPSSVSPVLTFTPAAALPSPFVCDDSWQTFPVIPQVTDAARTLYRAGLAQGNDPRAFSKIGDGEISTDWFFTPFDLGEEHYDLGTYQVLEDTIENFQGSFQRRSVAAQRGFNTALILDASGADPALCNPGESSLDCELRIHNPSIAIISLGTNQVHRPEEFEAGMREIIDVLIARKVLPILSTKGDNLEGDHRINRTIACLAQEYQIPLWNFWAAIQPLPNHGLQPDLEHLTYSGTNDFDDPHAMQYAWAVRNLMALQALDEVWKSVNR